MIVTSYYDIYNRPDKLNEYMPLFNELVESGLPIILFTDPNLVDKFSHLPSNVKIIIIPLCYFELYNIAIKYNGTLPSGCNQEKDTKEFLALMNTKIEFILKASEVTNDETYIWLDFGIMKIVKNKKRFINKLKIVIDCEYQKIKIPGCWPFGRSFSIENVNWRFCGGLFIIPRKHILEFYNHSKNVLSDFCNLPIYKLSWETNVWNLVEYFACKDIIEWYYADHNDTILLNIDKDASQ